jgi:hypothetical protein
LLFDRLRGFEDRLLQSDNLDAQAWREYRERCEEDDAAKTRLLADTAAMVERARADMAREVERTRIMVLNEVELHRVKTAEVLNEHRAEQFKDIDRRFTDLWTELGKARPGATLPPRWQSFTNGLTLKFVLVWAAVVVYAIAMAVNADDWLVLCREFIAKTFAGH